MFKGLPWGRCWNTPRRAPWLMLLSHLNLNNLFKRHRCSEGYSSIRPWNWTHCISWITWLRKWKLFASILGVIILLPICPIGLLYNLFREISSSSSTSCLTCLARGVGYLHGSAISLILLLSTIPWIHLLINPFTTCAQWISCSINGFTQNSLPVFLLVI